MSVELALIAAIGRNNVIGDGADIPWRLPSDFEHFKKTTMGKPLIMGRKTFESIGRPLPGRTNIVVTRQAGYQPDGVLVFNDLDAAIGHARTMAAEDGVAEVMIGGGAEIYRATIGRADRLYISHVDLVPEGDAVFPQIDPAIWEKSADWPVNPSEKDSAAYGIAVYTRR